VSGVIRNTLERILAVTCAKEIKWLLLQFLRNFRENFFPRFTSIHKEIRSQYFLLIIILNNRDSNQNDRKRL